MAGARPSAYAHGRGLAQGRVRVDAATIALAAVTVLGAILRFSTLGRQSFWFDEAVAASLVRSSFRGMLSALPHSESSPPLFYVAAWGWSKVFGTSEIGLRSLSAVSGTLTIPVAYATTQALLRRRVASLAVAAFVAVSPIMVWYSQEARSYALYTLLSALSMLFCARSLDRPSRGNLWAWSACSLLAIATHYFAAFLVAGEVVLLFARVRRRKLVWPLLPVLVVGVALLPLALYQNRHVAAAASISSVSLGWRIKEVALRFVFLYYNPGGDAALVVALVLSAVLVYRGRRVGRAPAALALGAAALGLPLLLALFSLDAFFFRNALAAWLPLTVAVAAGLPRRSLGVALACAATLVFLAGTLAIARKPGLQRDSWRQAVDVLQSSPANRLIVGDTGDVEYTLRYYWPGLPPLPRAGAHVQDIAYVGRYLTTTSTLPGLPQFRNVGAHTADNMTVVFLHARAPRLVVPHDLALHDLLGRLER